MIALPRVSIVVVVVVVVSPAAGNNIIVVVVDVDPDVRDGVPAVTDSSTVRIFESKLLVN